MSVDRRALEWHAHLARRIRLSASKRRVVAEAAARSSVNSHVLGAVLRTEMVARPIGQRLTEFAAFLVLCAVWPARARRMTVGPAQVRVGSGPSAGVLETMADGLGLMSWSHACDAAASIIASAPGSDVETVYRHYNGPRCSENYVALVRILSK